MPALGYGATSMRRISSLTRSMDRIDVRDAWARIASTVPGASAKPRRATNRAARNMRSGSSAKVSAGSPGVRSTPSTRSVRPLPGEVDHLPVEALAERVHREVAARDVLEERAGPDVRVAGLGVVALRTGANSLDDPGAPSDLGRPEPLEPLRMVPAEDGRDLCEQRHRIHPNGDQVDVLALRSPEQAVPDEPADQVGLDAEAARRGRDGLEQILELRGLRGDHADDGGHGVAATRRAGRPRSSTAARIAASAAQRPAPRNTVRNSDTIAAVTSRS